MEIKEYLKSNISKYLIEGLLTLLLAILILILKPLWHPFVAYVLPVINAQLLLMLCLLLFLLCSILTFLLLSQRKPKLTPLYGVYWDKKGNAFCPKKSCGSLLSPDVMSGFSCPNCGHLDLRISNNEFISIPEAIKTLKS